MASLISELPTSEFVATLEMLDAHGITREHLKSLRKYSPRVQGDVLSKLKFAYIDGSSNVEPPSTISPLTGKWLVKSTHRLRETCVFNPHGAELQTAPQTVENFAATAGRVSYELFKESGLPAQAAYWLLENSSAIPSNWRQHDAVIFWGTSFIDGGGNMMSVALSWQRGDWRLIGIWHTQLFTPNMVAAVGGLTGITNKV